METLPSLVIAAQQGNRESFDKLVTRFQAMAYTSAYSMLNDAQLAEDVAQEAFIEAYLNLPTLREPAAFPGWFRRIVFKQGDRLTRGKQVIMTSLEKSFDIPVLPMNDLDPATVVEQKEVDALVHTAIADLPEHERIVTMLFYSTGYALKEIAAYLEVPVSTVKKRLFAARKHLKLSLLDSVWNDLHKQRHAHLEAFPEKVRLLLAVRTGDIASVQEQLNRNPFLINMKAEQNEQIIRIYRGLTPLYEAATSGNYEMTRLLLDYGALIHHHSYDALNGATFFNQKEIILLLLKYGANVNAQTETGEKRWKSTPLRLAAMKGYTEIVEILLQHGAIVDPIGPTGRTPLHWAALKGHREIVQQLVKSGADVSAQDELGRTPCDWARARGHLDSVEMFIYEHFSRSTFPH